MQQGKLVLRLSHYFQDVLGDLRLRQCAATEVHQSLSFCVVVGVGWILVVTLIYDVGLFVGHSEVFFFPCSPLAPFCDGEYELSTQVLQDFLGAMDFHLRPSCVTIIVEWCVVGN